MKRTIALFATIAIAACSNSSGAEDSLCGDGEELQAGGTAACLYTAEHELIEEGFVCPPDVGVRMGADGTIDEITTREFDAEGRTTLAEYDWDGDQIVDARETSSYSDTPGDRRRRRRHRRLGGGPGV